MEQPSGTDDGLPDWLDEWIRERIPKRFQAVTLDGYNARTQSQMMAASAVRAWIDSALDGQGPMLALAGSQGTGKSHLLYAAGIAMGERVAVLRQEGYRQPLPRFEPWYRLADQLRYSDEKDSIRNSIYGSPIVMIDEVRPTSGTNFDDTELAKLACHAYDDRAAVLITTNVHPLDKVMGPAAASRFRTVVVQGPDHRQAA